MELWIIKSRPPGRREWSRGRLVGNGSYEVTKPVFDQLKKTLGLGGELSLTKTNLILASIEDDDDEDN